VPEGRGTISVVEEAEVYKPRKAGKRGKAKVWKEEKRIVLKIEYACPPMGRRWLLER